MISMGSMALGIDLGTGSVKTSLVDRSGRVVDRSSARYRRGPAPGEADPLAWWAAVVSSVQALGATGGDDIAAIGLSGQMHGIVLVDHELQPVRPAITWMDLRSLAVLDDFEKLAAPYSAELANPTLPGFAALTLLWLREREPVSLARTAFVLSPKDWLGLRLTGAVATDPTDASATLLWDIPGGTWHAAVVRELGVEHLLPDVRPSGSLRGELSDDAATSMNLRVGTPVAIGLADTPAALVGTACFDSGVAQATVGTGAQICVVGARPQADASGRTHVFCGPRPDEWYALAAISSAGVALEWVRALFDISWDQFYDEAFETGPHESDPLFHPYVMGERTPHMDPYLTADWIGARAAHSRSEFLRSALEGVAFALCDAWDALDVGPSVGAVQLAGGGSIDIRFQQLLADAMNMSIRVPSVSDASSRGAALSAAQVAGWIRDLADQRPCEINHVVDPGPNVAVLAARLDRFRSTTRGGSSASNRA